MLLSIIKYGVPEIMMLSLQFVDAEFVGIGSGWPQVMGALFRKKLVSYEHLFDAEVLWSFGHLINNTDMHLGNLGLAIEGDVFRLLPVYDMCAMGFAPKSTGEVLPYSFIPPEYKNIYIGEDKGSKIKNMAHDFWDRVANDNRISDEFSEFLKGGNPIDLMG